MRLIQSYKKLTGQGHGLTQTNLGFDSNLGQAWYHSV